MSEILKYTEGYDNYASRRKINKPEYEPLLEELVTFAQARLDRKHDLGMAWFCSTGMDRVNAEREKRGETPIPVLGENSLKNWLSRHHPELREAFRR